MKRLHPKRLLNYFFQGLIILAPIVITAWTVMTLFNLIDDILPNLLQVLAPDLVKVGPEGRPEKVPGLGFLVVLLVVFVVGYISSTVLVSKLVDLFDSILEKTPGIKLIYTTVKDFMEAFAGNKRKFNKAVLVSIDGPDIWRIGFITQDDVHNFGLESHVSVYVPNSYAFAGVLYLVPKDKIRKIDKVNASEAMKFVISGGVTEMNE